MTHKFLPVVISKKLLQLQVPVVPSLEDTVLKQRLTHVASPRVKVASAVRRPRVHQDVQAVHTETPAGAEGNTLSGEDMVLEGGFVLLF